MQGLIKFLLVVVGSAAFCALCFILAMMLDMASETKQLKILWAVVAGLFAILAVLTKMGVI